MPYKSKPIRQKKIYGPISGVTCRYNLSREYFCFHFGLVYMSFKLQANPETYKYWIHFWMSLFDTTKITFTFIFFLQRNLSCREVSNVILEPMGGTKSEAPFFIVPILLLFWSKMTKKFEVD